MSMILVLSLAVLVAFPARDANGADQMLEGRKLLLKSRLEVLSLDRAIDLGGGAGSSDDPTIEGGSLRLIANGGAAFDLTIPLDAASWKPLTVKNPAKGWKFGPGTQVKKVLVKTGKQIKIIGTGFEPATLLATDPTPVDVILALGQRRYCLRFGEASRFRESKKLLAKNGGAPDVCGGSDPSTTTTTTVPTTTTVSTTTLVTTSTTVSTTSTTTTTIMMGCPPSTGAIVNGCFELPVTTSPSNGWSFANQDGGGGWRSSGGNPDGYFILNEGGNVATDPTLSQTVTGLTIGQPYRLRGEYRAIYSSFGNPAKPDAFAVRIDPQPSDHGSTVVLALPRPTPDPDAWTAFEVDFTPTASEVTITLEAERDGDDSSFAVDNVSLVLVP